MKKWRFVIDVAKCENCNNCFLSCKDEHGDNHWQGYAAPQPAHGHEWIRLEKIERGRFPIVDVAYLPTPCQHCDDAPCMAAAENGAVYKRKDGIVLIDPRKAEGQKQIVNACPFGAIFWNEASRVPQKCTFCAHLLDEGWKKPRCVQACPTGALTAVLIDDQALERKIKEDNLERLNNKNTSAKPNVFYKNLHRFTTSFIAGSVASGEESAQECVTGAEVYLFKDNKQLKRTVTDDFGDFKFDHLPSNSGDYTIRVSHQGIMFNTIMMVNLKKSHVVPTIWI